MALPKIKQPKYKLYLGGIDKEINFRPFLVKDKKILMQSKENNEPSHIYDLVAELVKECTFGEIDPYTLPIFDLEYLFLHMNAKSSGEIIKMKYSYKKNREDPEEIATEIPVTINIYDVKPPKTEHIERDIELEGGVFIRLKYPTIKDMSRGEDNPTQLLSSCIDCIYTKSEHFETDDVSKEELENWMGDLSSKDIEKLSDFFKEMPRIELKVPINLPDGNKKEIALRGLTDFFG